MKYFVNLFLVFSLLSIYSCQTEELPIETIKLCNGSATLCNKKYNEVVFGCTHNAYNYPTEPVNFVLNNQSQSIQQQLNDGIRALMLDVYYGDNNIETDDETIWLYHGTSIVGFSPLKKELEVISNFLKNNPTEVLTIILECYVEFSHFSKAIEQSELAPFLYHPKADGQWPSLQKMIEENQRLVILTDVQDVNADSWYIYVWDVAFETHYSNKSRSDFNCDINRGDANNSLFIFNHFITQVSIGTGLIDSSTVINQYDYLLNRLKECQSHHNQIPNFVTVDFYDTGNVMEVVNHLNKL